jgi:hypothetical protein
MALCMALAQAFALALKIIEMENISMVATTAMIATTIISSTRE